MSLGNFFDLMTISDPMGEPREQPIVLAPRIVQRFFEPIILLKALTDAVKSTANSPPPEGPIDIRDPNQLFCAVVNKFSHVCDSQRGGSSVYSFVFLKSRNDQHGAHCVFTANRQTDEQLNRTAVHVRTLLRKVGQTPENKADQQGMRISLLHDILRFNRPRVTFYLQHLKLQAASCLEKCRMDETDENKLIAEALEKVLADGGSGTEFDNSDADYIEKCGMVIKHLIRIEKSTVGAVIMKRAAEDRIPGFRSRECWSEILHTIRRILAYPQSIQFFFLAKERWPDIFRNPLVSFVSSSDPIAKPGRNKSYSAESIVGRMTSKEKEMRIFKDFVNTLQVFNLDDRIKNEYSKDTFSPIVHSEIRLLDCISNTGGVASSRFFNDWKYIGSSKPICKLCDYYFQEHQSAVDHRASHGNLYPSWRVPDVYPHQGQDAVSGRQKMVDRVLQRVRKDAFDIVRKKALPSLKDNDSNTFSARVTLEEKWTLHGSTADAEEVASRVESLVLEGSLKI